MRLRAKVYSAPLLTAGAIAAGAALAPFTDASAATVVQQPRAVMIQRSAPRPAAVPRPAIQRQNVQRTIVQHNVVQPNLNQRVVPNNVRPVNPNPGFNPNFNRNPGLNPVPNRGNVQFHNQPLNNQPFNNQQRVIPAGPGGMPHNVVGGPVNGLRMGPGRPNLPSNVHLVPGPGGLPGIEAEFSCHYGPQPILSDRPRTALHMVGRVPARPSFRSASSAWC